MNKKGRKSMSFHSHRKAVNLVLIVALASALAWLGGLTRPYAAFGGEDLGALCLIAYGIHNYIAEKKEEERR